MRFFNREVSDGNDSIFFEAPQPFTKNTEKQRLRYCVGAALYMPATREMIAQDIIAQKHPALTTIVIDLEDALGDLQVEEGMAQLHKTVLTLQTALNTGMLLEDHVPLLFVRVRSAAQLQQVMNLLGELQHVLTGYVLPKFTKDNGRAYLELIAQQNERGFTLYAMPILESKQLIFKETRMEQLLAIHELVKEFEPYILNIRIGSTDFCGLFGVRRTLKHTIYDIQVVRDCMTDIMNVFLRGNPQFVVSGSVWEYFGHDGDVECPELQGLLREVELDRLNGLIGKTIIHPSHIKAVQAMYVVTHEDFMDAQRILQLADGQIGVQKSVSGNKMNEMKPHYLWAQRTMMCAEAFGVLKPTCQAEDLLKRKVPQVTSYNVLNKFSLDVQIADNPYHFEQNELFDMAMRINKKRSFLFVSKVLGKHLAVRPQISILASYLLAHRYIEVREQTSQQVTAQMIQAIQTGERLQETLELVQARPVEPKKPLRIIGFAETATALGHAFFDAFTGDVGYIHTTREQLMGELPTVTFEEEHSHASSHRLYAEPSFFDGDIEVVLVDDEMTTGKTNRNIIRQLHEAYPHIQTVTLVSILDWRNDADQQAFLDLAHELGITIHSAALVTGQFSLTTLGELPTAETLELQIATTDVNEISLAPMLKSELVTKQSLSNGDQVSEANYYLGSGRFGLTVMQQREYAGRLVPVAQRLTQMRSGEKALVLGTGEFMYIPMAVASQMGNGVYYHSSTRSPIYPHLESTIHTKIMFNSPEFPGVTNYLYNISPAQYDDIFILFERVLDHEALATLIAQLKPLAKHVHAVTLGGAVVATI